MELIAQDVAAIGGKGDGLMDMLRGEACDKNTKVINAATYKL
ncbi:MAG: hypothetical protein ACI3VB_04830 [Oscillospiraceae bacterium]